MREKGFIAPLVIGGILIVIVIASVIALVRFRSSLSQPVTSTVTASPTPNMEQSPIATTTLSTNGLSEYKNIKYRFGFQYLTNYILHDFTDLSSKPSQNYDQEKFNLNLETIIVSEAPYADGPCGHIDPKSIQEQKQLFEKTNPGENFNGFDLTGEVKNPKVIKSDSGVKIAYGISICQGNVGNDDPGTFAFMALTFTEDTRVSLDLYLTAKQSGNIKVRDLAEISDEISKGKYNGEVQETYNEFVKILKTFQIF